MPLVSLVPAASFSAHSHRAHRDAAALASRRHAAEAAAAAAAAGPSEAEALPLSAASGSAASRASRGLDAGSSYSGMGGSGPRSPRRSHSGRGAAIHASRRGRRDDDYDAQSANSRAGSRAGSRASSLGLGGAAGLRVPGSLDLAQGASHRHHRDRNVELEYSSSSAHGDNEHGLPMDAAGEQQHSNRTAKQEVRDMLYYLLFVVLFTTASLSTRNSQEHFWLTDGLRRQLTGVEFAFKDSQVEKTFEDVETVEEAWMYLRGPFFDAIYTASTFDGDGTYPTLGPTSGDGGLHAGSGAGSLLNERGMVAGQSRIVGGIRLGQLRQATIDCELPPEMAAWREQTSATTGTTDAQLQQPQQRWACVSPLATFGSGDLLTEPEPWGVGIPPNLHTWLPDPPYEPSNPSPHTVYSYGVPNVAVELPNPAATHIADVPGNVSALFATLEAGKWIDRKTRAVLVDLTVYNANIQYFTTVRLVMELPPSAGVVTFAKFATLRLYRDHLATDHIRTAIEIAVFLMVLSYTYSEVRDARKLGFLAYVQSGIGRHLHSFNLALFFMSFAFRILALLTMPTLDGGALFGSELIPFRTPVHMLEMADDANAFNSLLTWLKVFRYLNVIPQLSGFLGTLQMASSQVAWFFVICAVVVFGSSEAFTLAFGSQLYGYRNLTQSFYSLVSVLLGDFDLEALRSHQVVLGPVLFSVYTLLSVFVLASVFIAIVSESWQTTRERIDLMAELKVETFGKEVLDVLRDDFLFKLPLGIGRGSKWCCGRLTAQRRRQDRQRALQRLANALDANRDGVITTDELLATLDQDGDDEISAEETMTLLQLLGIDPDDVPGAAAAQGGGLHFGIGSMASRKHVAELLAAAGAEHGGDAGDAGDVRSHSGREALVLPALRHDGHGESGEGGRATTVTVTDSSLVTAQGEGLSHSGSEADDIGSVAPVGDADVDERVLLPGQLGSARVLVSGDHGGGATGVGPSRHAGVDTVRGGPPAASGALTSAPATGSPELSLSAQASAGPSVTAYSSEQGDAVSMLVQSASAAASGSSQSESLARNRSAAQQPLFTPEPHSRAGAGGSRGGNHDGNGGGPGLRGSVQPGSVGTQRGQGGSPWAVPDYLEDGADATAVRGPTGTPDAAAGAGAGAGARAGAGAGAGAVTPVRRRGGSSGSAASEAGAPHVPSGSGHGTTDGARSLTGELKKKQDKGTSRGAAGTGGGAQKGLTRTAVEAAQRMLRLHRQKPSGGVPGTLTGSPAAATPPRSSVRRRFGERSGVAVAVSGTGVGRGRRRSVDTEDARIGEALRSRLRERRSSGGGGVSAGMDEDDASLALALDRRRLASSAAAERHNAIGGLESKLDALLDAQARSAMQISLQMSELALRVAQQEATLRAAGVGVRVTGVAKTADAADIGAGARAGGGASAASGATSASGASTAGAIARGSKRGVSFGGDGLTSSGSVVLPPLERS